MSAAEDQKTSSEILNELFSTFNTTYNKKSPKKSKKESKKEKESKKKKKKKRSSSSDDSDVDSRIKKSRKSLLHGDGDGVKKKKKKRQEAASSSSSAVASSSSALKKKKKKKSLGVFRSTVDDGSSVPIGDGFVVLKKSKPSKPKDLEDGEIVEELESREKKQQREKSSSSSGKMSASQAYKLDAEERLLLGYDEYGKKKMKRSTSASFSGGSLAKRSRSTSPSRRTSHHHHHHKMDYYSEKSPSSSSSSRSGVHRDRSKSPSSYPRVAPPRDSYRSSYLRFEKQREYEHDRQDSSRSSYDTASYYDYHAQRSRETYSSGRSGFGYVGKSYYYDDVVEDRPQQQQQDRGDRNSEQKRYGTSAWRHRGRSRSKSPPRRSYYHPDDIIDKAQLLEIARKNAKKLMKSGVLPSDIFSRDQILAIKAGGKSVDELTQYCKKLAKRDAVGDARSGSDSEEDSRGDSHFIHHPFQVKDKPLPTITLNIRNAVPLPVRTPQELAIESAKLRTQFPVSSGTQHRFKEIEWKPVSAADDDKKDSSTATETTSKAIVPLDDKSSSSATGPNVATVAPMVKESEEEPVNSNSTTSSSSELKAIEAPPPKAPDDTGISVDGPDLPAVDIGSVIGLRLKAMRMLQENPKDGDAQTQLEEATKMMKFWADAKALEPKFLTPAELSSGPQAWAKRDQLRKTRALDSGMGMHLLQKMGWRPGEGLGKNKEGQLEPLALDVKTDKKGLTAAVEELMYGKSKGGSGGGGGGPSMPVVYDLSGKHPVSALMELTAKRRWGNAEFSLVLEHGPPHKRQFVYKVIVNGVEYQPCVAVGNKKQAKANAAAFCLQSLGLLPTNCTVGPGELLQTVTPDDQQPPPSQFQPTTATSSSSSSLTEKFGAPSYLQTVQSPQPVPPPPPQQQQEPTSVLMPPPPPPPPLFGVGK